MVNIAPIIAVTTAANALTVSNLTHMQNKRLSGHARKKNTQPAKVAKPQKPHEVAVKKFEEAWQKQEERLSGLKLELVDAYEYNTISEYGWTVGQKTYNYPNGKTALVKDWDDPESEVTRYDELGNVIEVTSTKRTYNYDDVYTTSHKCVYYPNSKQKEFEWDEEGIRHFDSQGNDDSSLYFARLKIAVKRVREEIKSDKTFKKMGKVEKAVAIAFQDKPELTWLEKRLVTESERSKEK